MKADPRCDEIDEARNEMALKFSCEAIIPATPAEVYEAWLDGELHQAMTGAPAEANAEAGGTFQAWGGYISGHNIELTPNRRIVQAWRTLDFTDDEPDSRVEVTFEATEGGVRIAIEHSDLPAHGMQYLQGWQDHYYTPMTAYFAS